MWFHSFEFKFYGAVTDLMRPVSPDGDIADEFHLLARSMGFEGPRDSGEGLWSTQFVYDSHSSLCGDFLGRGLSLELLCESNARMPFAEIFYCMQRLLGELARCEIVRISVACERHSVSMQRRRFVRRKLYPVKVESLPPAGSFSPPRISCSKVEYGWGNGSGVEAYLGEVPVSLRCGELEEAAAPIAVAWDVLSGWLNEKPKRLWMEVL